MKTTPKRIFSLAGLLLLAVPFLHAADEPAAGTKPDRKERRQGGPNGPAGQGAVMDRAAQELGLSADQEAKWKDIGKQEREALKPLRDDASLSPEDRRAKAMEINKGFAAQRRALLTPEQAAKFDEMRGKMHERGGERKGKKNN